MNIVLAGMPGSGKSTVLRHIAALTGARAFDTDEEIVRKYGPIPEIFDKYGETCFRNLETETVKSLSALDGVVIATGGGCLMREENVAALKESGKIVYLKTSLSELVKRVDGGDGRPLLAGGAAERLEKLLKERAHTYESAADITVETDGLAPDKVAEKIVKETEWL